jgi:hypothetical protein
MEDGDFPDLALCFNAIPSSKMKKERKERENKKEKKKAVRLPLMPDK